MRGKNAGKPITVEMEKNCSSSDNSIPFWIVEVNRTRIANSVSRLLMDTTIRVIEMKLVAKANKRPDLNILLDVGGADDLFT